MFLSIYQSVWKTLFFEIFPFYQTFEIVNTIGLRNISKTYQTFDIVNTIGLRRLCLLFMCSNCGIVLFRMDEQQIATVCKSVLKVPMVATGLACGYLMSYA